MKGRYLLIVNWNKFLDRHYSDFVSLMHLSFIIFDSKLYISK
jgi:hypothetical protein